MRTILFILSIIICSGHLYGQIGDPSGAKNIEQEFAKLKHLSQISKNECVDEKDIAGSPYLNKQFEVSDILQIDGTKIRNMPLRYNIYNNTMEFLKDGKILAIAVPFKIQRITMDGNVFTFNSYNERRKNSSGYFQIVYEGNYQLLKKDRIILKLPPDKSNAKDSLRFERISPQFYLRYGDGMAHLVNSQKSLIKRLQPVSKNIIDYIKLNRINTINEEQLIKLMEYMDNLDN
jgi:hypothetical protein